MTRTSPPSGVGLGLRWDFLDEVLAYVDGEDDGRAEALAAVPFFEVSPENYMRRGGFFPAALDRIAARYPLTTHGLSMSLGGVDPFDPAYMKTLKAFLDRFGSAFHSDHLCFCGVDERNLHDLLPLPLSRASAAHVAARVREAASRLARPMAVENITHYLVPGQPLIDEATFIGDILDQSGCGLVLDVNNVYVNGQNYGFDPYAWLAKIPLDRVVEVHIAGHERDVDDDVILDTHGAPVLPVVADLLTWLIERTGPLPVLLERDNRVPPIDELLEERARIAEAYERGLALFENAAIPRRSSMTPSITTSEPDDAARVARLLHLVQRIVRDPEAPAAITGDARRYLAKASLPKSDEDALARVSPKRLLLYRKLVRRGLAAAIRIEIPRTAARLGAAFDETVTRFLDEELPRSHYLRDVGFELVAWAAPRWKADPEIPDYLIDLANHELTAFEAAVAEEPGADEPSPLSLDRAVRFRGTSRVARYAYAIHRLDERQSATDVPLCEPTLLFVYRDADHHVRHLELSALAGAILDRLLAGETLKSALVFACEAEGQALDDAVLAGTTNLLADLGERGVLLGSA